jgi:transposase-like protein
MKEITLPINTDDVIDRPTSLSRHKSLTNFYHSMLYRVHLNNFSKSKNWKVRNKNIESMRQIPRYIYIYKYIDILNSQLQSFQLKFTERLENRHSSKTIVAFDNNVHKIAIFSDELENVKQLHFCTQF